MKKKRMMSVKHKIILIAFLGASLSMVTFGIFTFSSLISRACCQVKEKHQQNVDFVGDQIDKAIHEMHNLAAGLTYHGGIIKQVEEYLDASGVLEQKRIRQPIESQLILYDFFSSVIGFIAFYEPNNRNMVVISNDYMYIMNLQNHIPYFLRVPDTQFFCPHLSVKRRDNNSYVLSLARTTISPSGKEIAIYIESDHTFLIECLGQLSSGDSFEPNIILLTDGEERIVYQYDHNRRIPSDGALDNLDTFRYTSNEWELHLQVPASGRYNRLVMPVLREFLITLSIYILTYAISMLLVYRASYRLLESLQRDIGRMDIPALLGKPQRRAGNDEFTEKIGEMREQIRILLLRVKNETRKNMQLENQLLISKLNPHFLHNTLNSIKLQIEQVKQPELAETIASLNNLLHYNLRASKIVYLQEELHAIDYYIALQKRIHSFTYTKIIILPKEVKELPVPSFILQPIIENCFKHGNSDDLHIQLRATYQNNCVTISIQDNGRGLSNEQIDILNRELRELTRIHKGIGLQYVASSLRLMFASAATVTVDITEGGDTEICIMIRL
ncbi:MAG TPA: hypothetical protein DIW17_06495 [Clostridiales bacterium]|nr:hypothetical protein [Clostridiales bacterium]